MYFPIEQAEKNIKRYRNGNFSRKKNTYLKVIKLMINLIKQARRVHFKS